MEALSRGGLAAGALAVAAEVFGSLSVATNHLTYGITHAPGVESGLTKLLGAATVATSFTPLGVGTIAAVVAVVLLLLLLVTKIVIATLLALLYVAAPLAIALWPLPETSWLARTWLQSLIGVLLWPVVWALCFALFAVMGASAFTLTGSFGTELVKPWVAVAALFVSFKAPQLLARQAMLAGLTPRSGTPRRAASCTAAPLCAPGRCRCGGRLGAVRWARPAPRPRERGRRRSECGIRRTSTWRRGFAWARSRSASGRRSRRPARSDGGVRRVRLALADERDDLRLDRRRRHAGRPVLRGDGPRVLRGRVRGRRVAVLARAAPLSPGGGLPRGYLIRGESVDELATATPHAHDAQATDGGRCGTSIRRERTSGLPEAGALCPVEALDREGLLVTSEGALVRYLRVTPKNPLVMSQAEREHVGHALGQLVGVWRRGSRFSSTSRPRRCAWRRCWSTARRRPSAPCEALSDVADDRAEALRRLHAALAESLERHADAQAAVDVAYYVVVPYLPDQRVRVDWRQLLPGAAPGSRWRRSRSRWNRTGGWRESLRDGRGPGRP